MKKKKLSNYLLLLAMLLCIFGVVIGNPILNAVVRQFGVRVGGNYIIIVEDPSWKGDSVVQEFKLWKDTQGYAVETYSVSDALIAFPVTSPSNLVFATEIISATGLPDQTFFLYHKYSELTNTLAGWGIFGYTDPYYIQKDVLTEAYPIILSGKYWNYGTFALKYRDSLGTVHNLNVTPPYPFQGSAWGYPAIRTDGSLKYIEDACWSIKRFVDAMNAQYVFLVGDKVPSFPVRKVLVCFDTGLEADWALSDVPYASGNIVNPNGYVVDSTISVGRIPTTSLDETRAVLEKTMRFQPHQSNRLLAMQGYHMGTHDPVEWENYFNWFIGNASDTISSMNPLVYVDNVKWPGNTEINNELSEEKGYVLIYSHGDGGVVTFGVGILDAGDFNYISSQHSSFVALHACLAGNWIKSNSAARGMILDADSEIVSVIACVLPVGYPWHFISFFQEWKTHTVVGDAWKLARGQHAGEYHKLIHQLLGDPALDFGATIPPSPVGWLELTIKVDGEPPSPSAVVSFQITFPNGTVRNYSEGSRVTVANCPSGSGYTVSAMWDGETQTQSNVEVLADVVNMVVFNFYTSPPLTGSIYIGSSVAVSVKVNFNGVYQYNLTAPCSLSNVETGLWSFEASYGGTTLMWQVYLREDAYEPHTFNFSPVLPDFVVWGIPLLVVGCVVVAVLVRRGSNEVIIIGRLY